LSANSGSFKETAASIVSVYYYRMKDYSKAINYYQSLANLASTPSSLNAARLGIMRCSFFLNDYQMSKEFALLIMENPSLTENIKVEANYALGLSCYYLNDYVLAIDALSWLVNNTTTFMGSEAKFTLAQIHFNQDDLESAKNDIQELLQMKPSYDFWIAKGLILKSKILIKEGDLFQAEQNLNAVIEHYPVQDDGILEEANELMQQIELLKTEVVEEEDPETKIEIDEN
jgi:tetratricopeptide (TPR) repeat protein